MNKNSLHGFNHRMNRDLWDNIKKFGFLSLVSKKHRKEYRVLKILEVIIAENLRNLVEGKAYRFQKLRLKAARENQHITYRKQPFKWLLISH